MYQHFKFRGYVEVEVFGEAGRRAGFNHILDNFHPYLLLNQPFNALTATLKVGEGKSATDTSATELEKVARVISGAWPMATAVDSGKATLSADGTEVVARTTFSFLISAGQLDTEVHELGLDLSSSTDPLSGTVHTRFQVPLLETGEPLKVTLLDRLSVTYTLELSIPATLPTVSVPFKSGAVESTLTGTFHHSDFKNFTDYLNLSGSLSAAKPTVGLTSATVPAFSDLSEPMGTVGPFSLVKESDGVHFVVKLEADEGNLPGGIVTIAPHPRSWWHFVLTNPLIKAVGDIVTIPFFMGGYSGGGGDATDPTGPGGSTNIDYTKPRRNNYKNAGWDGRASSSYGMWHPEFVVVDDSHVQLCMATMPNEHGKITHSGWLINGVYHSWVDTNQKSSYMLVGFAQSGAPDTFMTADQIAAKYRITLEASYNGGSSKFYEIRTANDDFEDVKIYPIVGGEVDITPLSKWDVYDVSAIDRSYNAGQDNADVGWLLCLPNFDFWEDQLGPVDRLPNAFPWLGDFRAILTATPINGQPGTVLSLTYRAKCFHNVLAYGDWRFGPLPDIPANKITAAHGATLSVGLAISMVNGSTVEPVNTIDSVIYSTADVGERLRFDVLIGYDGDLAADYDCYLEVGLMQRGSRAYQLVPGENPYWLEIGEDLKVSNRKMVYATTEKLGNMTQCQFFADGYFSKELGDICNLPGKKYEHRVTGNYHVRLYAVSKSGGEPVGMEYDITVT